MILEKINTAEFYEALAHLFYAAAMADKSIVRDEKLKIIESVESNWNINIQKKDSKEIIYKTLKQLISNTKTSDQTYKVFETFFKENSGLFTKELRDTLIKIVSNIANAYSKKSKGELILIGRLHILLK